MNITIVVNEEIVRSSGKQVIYMDILLTEPPAPRGDLLRHLLERVLTWLSLLLRAQTAEEVPLAFSRSTVSQSEERAGSSALGIPSWTPWVSARTVRI